MVGACPVFPSEPLELMSNLTQARCDEQHKSEAKQGRNTEGRRTEDRVSGAGAFGREEQLRRAGASQKQIPGAKGGKRRGRRGAAWTRPVPAASFQPRGLALPNLGCETEGCGDY